MSTLPCWVKGRRGENSPRYHLFQMPEVQTTDSSLFAIYGERKCRIWIGNGSDTAFSYDDRTSLCNCKCWYAGANFPSSGRCLYHRTKIQGIYCYDRYCDGREHIRIEVKKDAKGGYKHYLSDNNSKNHTLYNSNYLENGEIVVLNNNDEIIIGRTVLRFNE